MRPDLGLKSCFVLLASMLGLKSSPCTRFVGHCAKHGVRNPASRATGLDAGAQVSVMPLLCGALRKARRAESCVCRLGFRRPPEAELALKGFVIGRHGQRQAHVACEELLCGNLRRAAVYG